MADASSGDVGYVRPDFSIFTAGMEIDGASTVERPIVRMIGSSTEKDLHSDTMTASALQDMTTRAPVGLLIWLNHDYTLPGSLFGSLHDTPMIIQKSGIADLHIAVEVELENPEAAQTYKYIQRGRRLGCSVGCQVEDYELVDSGEKSVGPLLHITHVRPVEWSVVGIPANQRSWVENAAKGLFERALSLGREDEAVKLAPIVKSLFPRNYRTLVKSIDGNNALKSELSDIPARPTPGSKILWEPTTQKFYFEAGENGQIKREIERTQVASFMDSVTKTFLPSEVAEQPPAQQVAQAVESHVVVRDADGTVHGHTENTGTQADMTVTVKLDEDDVAEVVKSLLEKAKEDASAHDAKVAAQKERAAKYHISPKEGGALTKPSEWANVPDEEWGDPVNYRYPMPDKGHADNAASRWGDESNRSQYSSEEQAIISKRIAARQAHFGEGEKSKKSVDITNTVKLEDGSTLYTFSDGSQRLETEIVHEDGVLELKAVDIAADGSHEPMKGTHTHKHANGDEMHNHKHSHDDDAKHSGAAHEDGPAEPVAPRGAGDDDADDEASKSAEVGLTAEVTPDATKSAGEPEAEKPEEPAAEPVAEAEEAEEAEKPEEPAAEPAENSGEQAEVEEVLDVQKSATLAVYNQLGASLGLPAVTSLKAAPAMPDGNAKVASLITTADNAIDELMRVLNIPDVDDKSAGDVTEKSGAEISAKNKARMKIAHDALAAMAGGVHCAAFAQAQGDAAQGSEKSFEDELAGMVEQAVAKAFDGLNEQMGQVTKALESLGSMVGEADRVKKEFALARKALEDVRVEVKLTQAQIDDVTGKGLGRPTRSFTQRQAPAEPALGISDVTEPSAEQSAVVAKSFDEAFDMTRKEYIAGTGVVRVWPKSAVKEFRPPLTNEEMSMMTAPEVLKYLDGQEARVPVLMR